MSNSLSIQHYREGECRCPSCGALLPAHTTWPGARFMYCKRQECTDALRKQYNGRYVAPDTEVCATEGCTNFIPEGFYGPYTSYLCCSPDCWRKQRAKRQEVVLCSCGCGETVPHRLRTAIHKDAYVSHEHQARHMQELFFKTSFGPFRPTVEQYFNTFAVTHYRSINSVRTALRRFFLFLNEKGYRDLNDVNCQTITDFLGWVRKNNQGVKSDLLSCITVFFQWLQATGLRTSANPVNNLLHRTQKEKRLPRPLNDDELILAWELLCERGDARLRLAFAIGEEAGLRIGEICRLRVSDVDLVSRRLFVRLPNKTNKERYAPFGPKTAKYFSEWMAERDASFQGDSLIYNYAKADLRNAFSNASLAIAFNKVLRKEYKDKLFDRGFEKWSTHRLRHTMGTRLAAGGADAAVIMGVGGWVDPDTMAGYVQVNPQQVMNGYQAAMQRAEQIKAEAPKTRVLTPKEVLELRRGGSIQAEKSPEERCV